MQILVDIIPAKQRRYVYGGVALLAFGYGAWQAAGGDWKAAVTALIGSAVTALAHANTATTPPSAPDTETSTPATK